MTTKCIFDITALMFDYYQKGRDYIAVGDFAAAEQAFLHATALYNTKKELLVAIPEAKALFQNSCEALGFICAQLGDIDKYHFWQDQFYSA